MVPTSALVALWDASKTRLTESPQRGRGIADRPPPRGGARRTPGQEGLRQRAIPYLEVHAFGRYLEGVRRDLGQRRPGAGPDVRGVDADKVASRTIDLHERSRWKLVGRIRRGGHAGPAEPGANASHARLRVARRPAEALRPFPQACDESATTERTPALGIDRRFVADAQLDRIEPTGNRQLVHCRLEREHAWALA